MCNLDEMIELHDTRLLSLEEEFRDELRNLQQEFIQEKEKIVKIFSAEKEDLTAVIEAIDQEEAEREAEAKQAHEQLREEIRNKNSEEKNMLRISLDTLIDELEQQFETAHLNYLQQTSQRTQDFKELTRNDQNHSKDIDIKVR
jgi:hypothetical protein